MRERFRFMGVLLEMRPPEEHASAEMQNGRPEAAVG
jgi:hypothetical protein